MQLIIDPDSAATLTSKGTIRCLLDMIPYPLPSRQYTPATGFARQLADDVASAAASQLEPPTGRDTSYSAEAELRTVTLCLNHIKACFDLFLDDCDPEVRRQADESTAQPIHVVDTHESGAGYRMSRAPWLDARVADLYAGMRDYDKGPGPCFSDSENPSLFLGGARFEGTVEEYEETLRNGDWPVEEWEDDGEPWEVDEVCGGRRAVDGDLEVLVKWKSGRESTWELYDDLARADPEPLAEYERLHGKLTLRV